MDFESFSFELIREVALQPSFDEAKYNAAKPKEIVEWIVEDLRTLFARRQKAVADTVRNTMEAIYKDNELTMDRTIHFPITDGHLGFHVPVELQRCKDTDGQEIYKVFSKIVLFTTIDDAWREHLREMDELRQSVQNAQYEQKDPLLIYKLESYQLFSKMLLKVNREALAILNKSYIPVRENNPDAVQQQRQQKAKVDVNKLQASRMAAAAAAGQAEKSKPAPIKVEKKVGRNDPCPCGSGKKYKQCHGKNM
jgi:preprotein translocase subunit SecA